MVYSSILYVYAFLPLSLMIYCAVPRRFKDVVLFLESLVFIALMSGKLLLFMLVYIAVNYISAHATYKMAAQKNDQLRVIPCAFGVFFDVLSLFAFRSEYFSWFVEPLKLPEGIFPLGISFVTLSAVGCLLDVFRGEVRADKNFVRFSLYLIMFPRLLVGPVVNYNGFAAILRRRRINLMETGKGLALFVKGLAKKVIIADQLYNLYTAARSIPLGKLSAATAWLGMVAYLLCLYFALSGLTDMGVGACRCFGFNFPNGFSYPMFSGKIRYFTSKWQIQSVHWFRRSITRPLTDMADSSRLSKLIFIGVWAVGGFWYGFTVSSMVWGLLMGAVLMIENRFRGTKAVNGNGILYTFVTVTLLAAFLQADSIFTAVRWIWAMFGGTRILMDSLSGYLLRYYIVLLLAALYASTDLFKNMTARVESSRFRWISAMFSPVVTLTLLMICTAMMSYTGESAVMPITL